LVLVLYVDYHFDEIMYIWDRYVCQKGVPCFLIYKCYVRSIKIDFFREYATIPIIIIIIIITVTTKEGK